MPSLARLFYGCVKRAAQLGGAYLVRHVIGENIPIEGALGRQPAWRYGGDPQKDFIIGNRDLSKQIVRRLAQAVGHEAGKAGNGGKIIANFLRSNYLAVS